TMVGEISKSSTKETFPKPSNSSVTGLSTQRSMPTSSRSWPSWSCGQGMDEHTHTHVSKLSMKTTFANSYLPQPESQIASSQRRGTLQNRPSMDSGVEASLALKCSCWK